MLNVLLVEDDLDLAMTIVQYLEIQKIRCDHASNGQRGLTLIRDNRYDVILLDLNLPRLDGLSVCREVRHAGDDTSILMLTARDRLDDKVDGFEAGADDYLVKPFELKELALRIRALGQRRSGQIKRLHYAGLVMDLVSLTVLRDGQPLHLSPTGWRLLEPLLRASPGVVSRRALEEAVWGEEPPDSNSLKVHMHHLRKAVDRDFDPPLIHTIPGRGFALREARDDPSDTP
ncbi:response regulator transcription factor [Halomonas denitrificans]|uniref:response regulator transcription factor n=1 Tax=Halomonas denitrificans TaxID=370769 RepID=UPI001CD33EC6|nr:response regulator transcription factor [Halomonas denitrificans]MCA0973324.1 response regulator transcription factor [Halomonas denitrificans]